MADATFRDEIITTTTIVFDWRDRLRVLLGARVTVQTRTPTENIVGRTRSTKAQIDVWFLRDRPPSAMMAGRAPEPGALSPGEETK